MLFRLFRTFFGLIDFFLPDTFVSEAAVDGLGYIVWSDLKTLMNVFLLAERCYLWKSRKTYILIHEIIDYLVDFWIGFVKYLELLSEEFWYPTDLYLSCPKEISHLDQGKAKGKSICLSFFHESKLFIILKSCVLMWAHIPLGTRGSSSRVSFFKFKA